VLVVALLTIDGLTRFGVLVGDSPVKYVNCPFVFFFFFFFVTVTGMSRGYHGSRAVPNGGLYPVPEKSSRTIDRPRH
jgi:hypothetical protein